MSRSWLLLLPVLSFGCSPSAGDEDLGPTGLLALPEHGVQIPSEPYVLAAGAERTRCFHHNLQNETALDVEGFATGRRPGQHHFNIFVSDLAKADGYGPCPTNEELFTGARPIVDGSGAAVSYHFPDGMALRLEPHALLIFQLHSINVTDAEQEQQFVLNLHTRETPASTLVDIYGFTNFGIMIPPRASADAIKECPMYDAIGLLTMSSHFHARGKRATGELIRENGETTLLYQTERWDDPSVMRFEQPIGVGRGDTIRFTCSYDNPDDRTVGYGPDADDEMCFLFGYYFPKVGLIPCF